MKKNVMGILRPIILLAAAGAVLCYLSNVLAAEGNGVRQPGWSRMPTKVVLLSNANEPLVMEVSLSNNDPVFKFCDAVAEFKVKSPTGVSEVKQWVKGFVAEIDETHKLLFSSHNLKTKDLLPGSVTVGLSCFGIKEGEDTTDLSPVDACNPLKQDCDNLCLAADERVQICQPVRRIFKAPQTAVRNAAAATKVSVTLSQTSLAKMRCGLAVVVPANKVGTTTVVKVKKIMPNEPLGLGENLFDFEIANNAAGSGYTMDFAKVAVFASCLEGNDPNQALWNIGAMARPELKPDLDWIGDIR